MNIFKDVLLPVLGKLDPTGIVNILRPKSSSLATAAGTTPEVVENVLTAIKGDPEMLKLQMEAEAAKDQVRQAMAEMSSENLKGISDIDGDFSWLRALCGSPRRIGVTAAVAVMSILSLAVGVKAVFWATAVADPESLGIVFDNLKWIVVGLGGAYIMKYFGKQGG